MPSNSGDTDYYFIVHGLEPLECEPVIRSLSLAHQMGLGDLGADLDEKIGVVEVRLGVEDRELIANYLLRNTMKLMRIMTKEDGQAILNAVRWFNFSKKLDDYVEIVELPVEQK